MANLIAGGSTLGILAMINRHVFLPLVEGAVEEISVMTGQEREDAQQELQEINDRIFNPLLDFVDDVEGSVIGKFEEFTGVDLNRDGDIGKPEPTAKIDVVTTDQ